MKKSLFLLIASIAIFAVACGSGGGSDEFVFDETPVSLPSISPTTSGTPITVNCVSDLWICTDQYGGSISTAEPYVGVLQVFEMFAEFANTDVQVEALLAESAWTGSKVVDEYELAGGEVAVVEGVSNNKTRWILLYNIEGKDDFALKCEATVNTDQYLTYKDSIEQMCEAVTAFN